MKIFWPFSYFQTINQKLDAILDGLRVVQRKEVILMKEVDELIVTVDATKGVAESTAVAIDQILAYNQQILDQIANTTDPVVIADLNAKLLAYNTAIAVKRDELLAAIPANPV